MSDDPYVKTAPESDRDSPPPRESGHWGQPGRVLGRYRIERLLGQGAMGSVYAAYDSDLDRMVALKVLHGERTSVAHLRLLREARAMARLGHANVVMVHEVGTAGAIDYVAMELIDGGTVDDWMQSPGLTARAKLDAFIQAGRGLAAAHAAGLVHRDFKPHNVLRASSGRVLVSDFGLARGDSRSADPAADPARSGDLAIDDASPEPTATPQTAPRPPGPRAADTLIGRGAPAGRDVLDAEATLAADDPGAGVTPGRVVRPPQPASSPPRANMSSTLTQSGALLGTPAYMAPEQYSGSAVGPAADQFAFCVSLWEALAGRRPFEGSTLYERRMAIDAGPDRASEVKIPRRLRPILRRGLRVDPAARWPTMDALLAALQPRRLVVPIALAAVALVAISIVVAIEVFGGSPRPRPALAPAVACDSDLGAFTSSPARTRLLATAAGADVVEPLDRLAADWTTARTAACAVDDPALRARRLACLDVSRDELVLATEVAATASASTNLRDLDAVAAVGDPLACASAPARVATPRDARSLAVAHFLAEETPRDAWPPDDDQSPACTRATWSLARSTQAAFDGDRQAALRTAADQAERCGDERLRAEIAVIAAEFDSGNPFALPGAVRRAELAVERAGNDRILAARVELLRAIVSSIDGDLDVAITTGVAAADALVAMRDHTAVVIATSTIVDILNKRGTLADQVAAERLLRAAIPHAGMRSQIYLSPRLAMALWRQHKIEDAHEVATKVDPGPVPDGITVRGRVVDPTGQPIARARVVASRELVGDSWSVSIAPERHTRTDATGAFELAGVSRTAMIAAENGSLRSVPAAAAAELTLKVVPTGSIAGHLERTGDVGQLEIAVTPARGGHAKVIASVAADGSYRVDGVILGPVRVTAMSSSGLASVREVVVGPTLTSHVDLAVANTRVALAIVVRSEVEGQLRGAMTYTVQGRVTAATLGDLLHRPNLQLRAWAREPDDATAAALHLQRGDLVARVRGVEPGDVTICATALGDLDDPAYVARLGKLGNNLPLRCTATKVDDKTGSVIVMVPALKRLE